MNNYTYEQELEKNGSFTYTCRGVSMLPMLRERRDLFTIEKKQGRLKKYDVALYKRPPDSFIMHRIVEVGRDSYVCLGDNCINKEYGITDEDIIGVMTSFERDGKQYSTDNKLYRAYCVVWYKLYPLRRLLMRAKGRLKRMLKKLLRR